MRTGKKEKTGNTLTRCLIVVLERGPKVNRRSYIVKQKLLILLLLCIISEDIFVRILRLGEPVFFFGSLKVNATRASFPENSIIAVLTIRHE